MGGVVEEAEDTLQQRWRQWGVDQSAPLLGARIIMQGHWHALQAPATRMCNLSCTLTGELHCLGAQKMTCSSDGKDHILPSKISLAQRALPSNNLHCLRSRRFLAVELQNSLRLYPHVYPDIAISDM